MKIYRWNDIKDKFSDSILIGNGASISVDKRFSYKLLFDEVKKRGQVNSNVIDLFQQYGTTNFELILRLLLETHKINEILEIEDTKTIEYYSDLRASLIRTISHIHPKYDEVKAYCPNIGKFLSGFDKVFSLNYDLLIYWTMLTFNSDNGQWFKDCFINGVFEKDWEFLCKPHGIAKGVTLVFYPHGALFLATEPFGGEVKVNRSNEDYLIDSVLAKWQRENFIPLFISEGTSKEKLLSITRNSYLNTVLDSILSKMTGSLVLYGWSMSDQDKHISNAIARSHINKIAISVYKDDANWELNCQKMLDKIGEKQRFRFSPPEIFLFDSGDPGCWRY